MPRIWIERPFLPCRDCLAVALEPEWLAPSVRLLIRLHVHWNAEIPGSIEAMERDLLLAAESRIAMYHVRGARGVDHHAEHRPPHGLPCSGNARHRVVDPTARPDEWLEVMAERVLALRPRSTNVRFHDSGLVEFGLQTDWPTLKAGFVLLAGTESAESTDRPV